MISARSLAIVFQLLSTSIVSALVIFGLNARRENQRAKRSRLALAKALQAEVFLTVVSLRESLARINEVRTRRAEGEILLHIDHSHDVVLSVYLANISRVVELPEQVVVLLQVFNHSVVRQNGLSSLLDRKSQEVMRRNPLDQVSMEKHYDNYVSAVDCAIQNGSTLNVLFTENFGNTMGVYMEETAEPGVVNIQIARKG